MHATENMEKRSLIKIKFADSAVFKKQLLLQSGITSISIQASEFHAVWQFLCINVAERCANSRFNLSTGTGILKFYCMCRHQQSCTLCLPGQCDKTCVLFMLLHLP